MRVFTPDRCVAYPVMRSEYMSHRSLRPHEPYLVDDTIAAMLERIAESGQAYGTFSEIVPRELVRSTKRLLILCPGGIGDLLCMKTCLGHLPTWYPNISEVGFVSLQADRQIFKDGVHLPFGLHLFDYPVTMRQAEYYDAWVAFGSQERQSLRKDLIVSFSEQLGMMPPAQFEIVEIRPDPAVVKALRAYIMSDRPCVAVQIHSAAHYRSWHTGAAFITMNGLVEAGYDCYIIGSSKQRAIFRDEEGVEQTVWGDGIYDMCGLFTTSEEMIAFTELMDGVIAPDSSMLHIGGMLGKPTLGLFGLTGEESRTKYYPTLRTLQGEADCSPCWCITENPTCGHKNCLAMMDIDPIEIVATMVEMLEGSNEQASSKEPGRQAQEA